MGRSTDNTKIKGPSGKRELLFFLRVRDPDLNPLFYFVFVSGGVFNKTAPFGDVSSLGGFPYLAGRLSLPGRLSLLLLSISNEEEKRDPVLKGRTG
jgi:hypothetical protein